MDIFDFAVQIKGELEAVISLNKKPGAASLAFPGFLFTVLFHNRLY